MPSRLIGLQLCTAVFAFVFVFVFFFVFLVFARSFQTGFVRLLLKCTTIQDVKSMPVIHKENTVLIPFGIFVKD